MASINIHMSEISGYDALHIGFNYGTIAEQLKDVKARLIELKACEKLSGGSVILVSVELIQNNPYILMLLTQFLTSMYSVVALYNSEMDDYIVTCTIGANYEIGQTIIN